jgi:hypothetical protein
VPRSPGKVKCNAATLGGQVGFPPHAILFTVAYALYGGVRAKWSLRCE